MRKLFVTVSILAAGATAIWLTDVGASVGDVIYSMSAGNQIILTVAQKAKVRDAALATWAGITGSNIDVAQGQTTFVAERIEVDVPDPGKDEFGNPLTTTHKEWQETGKQLPLFIVEAVDEQTLTDEQFAQLAVEGKLETSPNTGAVVKSLGRVVVAYGSPLETTWNIAMSAICGANISRLYKVKIWRPDPTNKTIIKTQCQLMKVEAPATFKTDYLDGKVDKAIGRVK